MVAIRGFELMTDPQPQAAEKYNTLVRWVVAQLGGAWKVVDRDLATPPGSPTLGALYIIAGSPTGAWSGHTGELTLHNGTLWEFLVPLEGDQARILDENLNLYYDGASWSAI